MSVHPGPKKSEGSTVFLPMTAESTCVKGHRHRLGAEKHLQGVLQQSERRDRPVVAHAPHPPISVGTQTGEDESDRAKRSPTRPHHRMAASIR